MLSRALSHLISAAIGQQWEQPELRRGRQLQLVQTSFLDDGRKRVCVLFGVSYKSLTVLSLATVFIVSQGIALVVNKSSRWRQMSDDIKKVYTDVLTTGNGLILSSCTISARPVGPRSCG